MFNLMIYRQPASPDDFYYSQMQSESAKVGIIQPNGNLISQIIFSQMGILSANGDLISQMGILSAPEVRFSDPPPSARPSYPVRSTQPAVLLDSLVTNPFPSLASIEPLPDLAIPTPLAPALRLDLPNLLLPLLPAALTNSYLFRTFLPAQLVPGGTLFASTLP